MSRSGALLLLAGCAGLLGGAWAIEGWLLRDLEVAPSNLAIDARSSPHPAAGRTERRRAAAAVASPAATAPAASDSPAVAAREASRRVSEPTLASASGRATEAAPEVAVADSPFAEASSPELDYAFELLRRPDAGPIEIDSATLVLQRCVDQAPGNERCLAGLVEARERAVASSALPPLLTPAQRRLAGQKPGLLRPENELPRPQRRGEGR